MYCYSQHGFSSLDPSSKDFRVLASMFLFVTSKNTLNFGLLFSLYVKFITVQFSYLLLLHLNLQHLHSFFFLVMTNISKGMWQDMCNARAKVFLSVQISNYFLIGSLLSTKVLPSCCLGFFGIYHTYICQCAKVNQLYLEDGHLCSGKVSFKSFPARTKDRKLFIPCSCLLRNIALEGHAYIGQQHHPWISGTQDVLSLCREHPSPDPDKLLQSSSDSTPTFLHCIIKLKHN